MSDPIPWPRAPEWTRVPDFTLPALEGGTRSRSEILSRGPAWFVFMKQSCNTCQMTAPYLERLHRFLEGTIGRVILILQEPPDAAREFVREYRLTMSVLLDEEPYPVSDAYNVSTVPTFFLVEMDGSLSRYSAAFVRDHIAEMATDLGHLAGSVPFRLFRDADEVPVLKPGLASRNAVKL